jgi:dCMP deaminase
MNMKSQSDYDKFYLNVAQLVSTLSYAEDKKVGAVIVKDDNIIAFSYNGMPRGSNNDTQRKPEYVLHAEAQAIAKVAKSTNSTFGSTLYCTLSPCIDCAKLIHSAGIRRVVYQEPYKCSKGLDFLKSVNIYVNQPITNTLLFKPEELKHTGLL